ncbi:unnamed protein product [Allacma fusca]|uniref:Gag-pol polyprotein n=1 Tax=Allacma fusca TaxID=39272 RepID=A0A8J2NFZ8_9HEXA|nr:unnamed protein product [Allacma fusca]
MRLVGYTDSDYAGDKFSRKSTTGTSIFLNDGIMSWTSQKQPCLALSSTEVEYIALASGASEAVLLRSLMQELDFPQSERTQILVDNQTAIRLVKNPEMHSRTKHIDVRYHYIRELVEDEQISVDYIPTTEQLADGLTKPLMKGKLDENRSGLGLTQFSPTSKKTGKGPVLHSSSRGNPVGANRLYCNPGSPHAAPKCSRPDISFAVSTLAQFMSGYDETDWKASKNVLRYLKGTIDMGITYNTGGNIRLVGYTDSDYAGDKLSRTSTTGTAIFLNDGIVSWTSQKQPCVALS